MPHVLAIDDDAGFLASLQNLFQHKQYNIQTESNPHTALKLLESADFDCILLDVKMPAMNGLDLLDRILKVNPAISVIMVSGQSTLNIAVEAIRKGAFDFLEKPVDADRLLVSIQNALRTTALRQERQMLLQELTERQELVGQCEAMQRVYQEIETVAPTDAKVLITGESGTGKELVARAIHLKSQRISKPYIKVNCAAVPETLIESTFYGHTKGSFSGAIRDQSGKFEMAHGGSIFLDEIGELNLNAQSKLLRVLQEGEIEKVGSTESRIVDVRIIAATNKNLKEQIERGKFREDLYHRLNVVTIHLPALKERKDDIPLLARYFLSHFADRYNKNLPDFTPQALQLLIQFDWPGNVRMLENVVEKIAIFAPNGLIVPGQVLAALKAGWEQTPIPQNDGDLKSYLERMEKEHIRNILIVTQGRKQEAAQLLGIDRTSLWKKMQKYGIHDPE